MRRLCLWLSIQQCNSHYVYMSLRPENLSVFPSVVLKSFTLLLLLLKECFRCVAQTNYRGRRLFLEMVVTAPLPPPAAAAAD